MSLNTTALNAMVDALTGDIAYLSAHTDDPGTTGLNEVSGGSYARKAVSWDAASGGEGDASAAVELSIPASTTVEYIGLWSAVTGGTFYGSKSITSETFGAAGTLKVTSASITATAS